MRLTFPARIQNRLPLPLVIALDLYPGNPDYAPPIRGAQIWAIVRLTPLAMGASCANAIILLATFGAVGALRPAYWIWAGLVLAFSLYYFRGWLHGRRFQLDRPASRRAIRRVVFHGALLGALWGAVPAVAFPTAGPELQLFIGCLTAGMMCAGALCLAPIPMAGVAYVLLVAAGGAWGVLQRASPVHQGLVALLASYTTVIIVNVNWSGALFVASRLAEARVRTEVAAREHAQAQTAHAERMTALGELAGGIAHDFNNVLQAVGGSVALIEHHLQDRDFVQRQTRRIEDAVERGGAISRRLLAFARRDVLSAEPIDARELLTEVGELLRHTIGPEISIRIDAADPSPGFLADRRQLETVLLNLATNARDAMPEGGRLTLSAASEQIAHDLDSPHLKAGRYVRLGVADSGQGMDPSILARAAEPFFTTKLKGKGTGLGLPLAKGFAEQSGGAFEILSEPGRGSAITLWLPQSEAAETPSADLAEPAVDAARGAERRVLVVDDDELVREMLMASLEDEGFKVEGAESSERALARFSANGTIDALVTDLSMPGMSGWDLMREVRTQRPELPVIMLTGHVGDAVGLAASHFHAERFLLLQKPVTPEQLARRLAALMATSEAGPAPVRHA
jgi:signal transduction histidine kinase/CheY-like chemotaxis protein